MKPTYSTRRFEVKNLEDICEYSSQIGWDIIYTQLQPGNFSGSYIERIAKSVITTSEFFSVPSCIRTGGVPGYAGLVIMLSGSPVKINGINLDPNSLCLLMPGSDVCVVTTGPFNAYAALFPESELEAVLGETYIGMKKSVSNVQFSGAEMTGEVNRFKNWFMTWLSNPFNQSEHIQEYLSDQIYETAYAALARIGEMQEKGPRAQGLEHEQRTKRSVLKLIDNFYSNPDNPMTTADMCSVLGMSRRNLYYNFKHYTGFTPHHVFKHIRLQAVQRDLSKQYGNVTEIATKYNFFHLSEFSALYKNIYGVLPSKFLKSAPVSAADRNRRLLPSPREHGQTSIESRDSCSQLIAQQDSSTELTQQSRKKCIFRGALKSFQY